ncbi:MAG: deoxynucleoside kinase [Deltaproteobacteria bacterium]|nr:deoxynucleoside kinase [Deltaproteobacteria bacterium]
MHDTQKDASQHSSAEPRLSYVAIEGCIGVGKTTLTHLLAVELEGRVVLEQFEDNPFLTDFYKDPVAHAFKTQVFFLLSRFKQQEQVAQTDLFKQCVVADYLFSKDRIFAELTLTGSEMSLYDSVFNALHARIQMPDVIVFLKAPMKVILERIKKRGREMEQDIDVEYLERLVNAYSRFFASFTGCPVLTVDTTELNFPERNDDSQLVFAGIRELLLSGKTHLSLGGPSRQPTLL